MSEPFFNRWSRRKQGLDPDTAAQSGSKISPNVVSTGVSGQTGKNAQTHPVAGSELADQKAVSASQPQPELPTLDDVQRLSPTSDFQAFMRQGVPGQVRNAAMKKLFTDPHFNVMDGLDIYIGDYNSPDPLPAGMLEKMVGAELLNLFPKKAQTETTQTLDSEVQENLAESPQALQAGPLVAQSSPDLRSPTWQASVAAHQPEPTENDHPDLQLQPNHAPASPGAGQGSG